MVKKPTKKEILLEAERKRREALAIRQARQAGPEGLSPERGRDGSPYQMYKRGHHFEDVTGGPRQYQDNELIHLDPKREPGFQEFECRLCGPPPVPAPPISFNALIDQAHVNPMLGNHDIQGQPRAVSEPHVDIDLTVTPPPRYPEVAIQPSLEADKAKPSLVKLWFHVCTPIPKTKAEKQAGTSQKYIDLTSEPAFNSVIQIHGATLVDVKEAVFGACAEVKAVCGSLLREADLDGKLAFKGYVAGRGPFLKSALKVIASEVVLDQFKETMKENKGKEVGFKLFMDNPKTAHRLKSKEDTFDRATLDSHPNSLAPHRIDELEMHDIDVNPEWQRIRVKLMQDYGCVSIGGRECMGLINPENTNEAVHLSHSMMDTWATALFKRKSGVTEMLPPKLPEFQFRRISNQPGHPHRQPAAPADNVQTTSQMPDNCIESPVPGPPPPLEDFLNWAKISPEDEHTRALLKKLDIIDYKAFLLPSLDVPTLAGLVFAYGTAVRLHDQAPLYRAELKRRKNPGFWD